MNYMDRSMPSHLQGQMNSEEWAIRVDLAAAYRLVADFGWDDLIFTHITARVPGPEHHFLINPYGYLFEEITASSLVKIDMNGNKVDDTESFVNPAGFTIHSAIHEAREDAQCVMHLHTVDGVAVSTHEGGLLPLNQTAMVIQEQIAFHEYEGIALDLDERPRLQSDLGEKCMMLLWNHGTLTLGNTVAETFLRMYFLERACANQVATLAQGPNIHKPSEASIETTRQQGGNAELFQFLADQLTWPALLRRLERIDPSYRS